MEPATKRLFRWATKFPPADRDYLSPAAQGRKLPPGASDDELRSWDALSSWDTLDGAIKSARGVRSAKYVVWFDIPDNCGVTYEPSGEPGHFDIYGDMEELKCYLVDDKVVLERENAR